MDNVRILRNLPSFDPFPFYVGQAITYIYLQRKRVKELSRVAFTDTQNNMEKFGLTSIQINNRSQTVGALILPLSAKENK